MLDYSKPDCTLTLRQAIDELREEDTSKRDVAPQVGPSVERLAASRAEMIILMGASSFNC
ncbi:MAG TPA: hypothetical protein VIL09_02535 [Microvirga sp.]|jgi:hypothetical protein